MCGLHQITCAYYLLLQIADENKPKNCAAEFATLQKAYNQIADNYTNLPTKLKNDGVERVEFGFERTDIGSTDLTDSKSMCAFAQNLVTLVKKAEGFHKQRLQAARDLICTKAQAMLKAELTSKLVNCLVKAQRDANQGGDATAKTDIQNDIDKFNKNGLKLVSKLFLMMKDKCLMKDTATSQAVPIFSVFKSTLKAFITKKDGGVVTWNEKVGIADTINYAVSIYVPHATNIVTIFKTTEADDRRQLRARRALATIVNFETTYDLDAPGTVGETFYISYGAAYEIHPSEAEIEPANASTQVMEDDQCATTTTTGCVHLCAWMHLFIMYDYV